MHQVARPVFARGHPTNIWSSIVFLVTSSKISFQWPIPMRARSSLTCTMSIYIFLPFHIWKRITGFKQVLEVEYIIKRVILIIWPIRNSCLIIIIRSGNTSFTPVNSWDIRALILIILLRVGGMIRKRKFTVRHTTEPTNKVNNNKSQDKLLHRTF